MSDAYLEALSSSNQKLLTLNSLNGEGEQVISCLSQIHHNFAPFFEKIAIEFLLKKDFICTYCVKMNYVSKTADCQNGFHCINSLKNNCANQKK